MDLFGQKLSEHRQYEPIYWRIWLTIYNQVHGKVHVGHGPYLHKYARGTHIPTGGYMLIYNMMCVCFGLVCLIDN